MATQFTPCPACGAVGEVGSNCQFCGTTIILKEGVTFSDARIIKQRTITPQQYAEKISIYHNIEGLCDGVSKVSIGEQEGIVNLNGDLIYPLGNERISKVFKDGVVKIGKKYLNLETFEYVEDPYLNLNILEKIKTLSEAIMNNPNTESDIYLGFGDGERVGFRICNAVYLYADPHPVFKPGLMLTTNYYVFEDYLNDTSNKTKCYNRFVSCECFKYFKTDDEFTEDGEFIHPIDRDHYILFGDDAENCCRTVLEALNQMYDIHPNELSEDIECCGDIFKENDSDNISNSNEISHSSNISNSNCTNDSSNISNSSNTNTSNSGCAGMLALILVVGGAGIYGLVELISKLIA